MNKKVLIPIIIVLVSIVAIVGIVVIKNNKTEKTNTEPQIQSATSDKLKTTEDMINVLTKINESKSDILPRLMVQEQETIDENTVKTYTGLSSTESVKSIVVSEPRMSSQAYSMVLVKVSDTSKIESMKQEMIDNINVAKWICISADEVYVTNYDDVICLVMATEEWAKPAYEAFKAEVGGTFGKELERIVQF